MAVRNAARPKVCTDTQTFERPEASRQLQAPVGEVDLTVAMGVISVEVVRVDGERALQTGAVADQDASALHGLEEPFVRVQGHRVGAIKSPPAPIVPSP